MSDNPPTGLPDDVETLQNEVRRLRGYQNIAAQLERSLERLRIRLDAILSNAPLAVLTINSEGLITMWEGEALKHLGVRAGEHVGADAFELLADNPVAGHLRDALDGQTSTQFLTLQNNRRYEARYAPKRNAVGDITGALCVALDVTDRAEAERRRDEALQQAQQKAQYLDTVLDALPVGVLIADSGGRIMQANSQAAAIWGGRLPLAEEIAGYDAYEAWWPESGQRVRPADWTLARALETHRHAGADIIDIQRFDGTRGTISSSAAPIIGADGTLLGGVVVIQDVTAQQKAERALRTSEERFRRLFEGSTHGVLLGDLYGALTYANQAALDMLGYTREQVEAGRLRWSDVTPVEYEPQDALAVQQLAATGRAALYEKEMIRQDGERIPVLTGAAVLEVDDSGREVIASFITDLSEHRAAERALRQSEKRLRQALDASHMGYWDWYVEDDRIVWGGYAGELLNPPDEREDRTFNDLLSLIHPTERSGVAQRLREAAEAARPLDVDFRTARVGDRGVRWVNMQGQPVTDAAGGVVRLSGVVTDITTRKQIERRWAEMMRREQLARAAAEDANEMKARFLAMISHELRTPLTSVRGFTSTLLAPDVEWDADSQREFIAIINEEAERLTELVEHLLDVSRMQAGALSVHPERESLPDLLRQAAPQLTVLAARHELVLDLPGDLPALHADRRRVVQVLANLVGNAAKFSPEGTPIAVSAHPDGPFVRFEVSDEGPGIPRDQRQRVFELFQQVEGEQKPQEGTGLGLAICKALVEAHGGRIWVKDRPGPGTTIAFTLRAFHPANTAS